MIKIGILIFFAVLFGSIVVCEPQWLSSNAFLNSFVSHEILALKAVILTVTLASVANIHLALNRIVVNRFGSQASLTEAAKSVKKEINDDAWYIFWGFIVTIVALVGKGAFDGNVQVVAASHGVALWVLLLYLVCMYDIYKIVFGVVDLEMDIGSGQASKRTKTTEDYTSGTPEP